MISKWKGKRGVNTKNKRKRKETKGKIASLRSALFLFLYFLSFRTTSHAWPIKINGFYIFID